MKQSGQAEERNMSLEQRGKEQRGQQIEPQAEEWNTQQPPNRDEKSPNTKG